MPKSRLVVLAPLLGFASALALLVATLLAISGIVGGATASQGCDNTASQPPLPIMGVPAGLRPIFTAAALRYRLGAQGAAILAGLTSVESGFGQNMGPSSAGAIGWTQFMPATWARYGVDANHDGRRDPYTAADAIFSSARYLQANGAPHDWYRALFAYNHSDAYVTSVLDRAHQLSANPTAAAPVRSASGGTLIVGDSLEVGTAPLLTPSLSGAVTVSARIGRSSPAGISVLRRLLAKRSYDTIVFDLGTNDATAYELQRSLQQLASLAGDRRVLIATVNSPFDEPVKNALLTRFASAHPDVKLVPWQLASRGLHLAGGIHGGYPQRARLFARALGTPPAAVTATGSCEAVIAPGAALGPITRKSGPARLVAIPGQPGMRVDTRILADVVYLIGTYHLTVTAAYATTGHEPDGEHPLGLAVDLVPGPGGSWDDVDRLAHWAEPVQNAPRPPFRWVGYNGDPGHGRGNHLHLSWMHAPDPARQPPAAWVDLLITSGPAA